MVWDLIMLLNLLLRIVYVIILLSFCVMAMQFKHGDLEDEILDVLVERSLPKPCKLSQGSHERISTEDLCCTIWG